MRQSILISLVATFALTGCGELTDMPMAFQDQAIAQDAHAMLAVKNFHEADKNHDGFLSKTEYVNFTYGQIRFVRAPSPEEVQRMKAGFGRKFDQLDTNHDKKLDLQEFMADGREESPTQVLPHPYTGLTVTAIEALPVRCPCFVLLAEAPGKSVQVEFSMGYNSDETAVVRHIDGVMVNSQTITQPATLRLIGEGLDGAAQKSTDPRVQQVADALKAGF